ncbi:MAG: hypothetical protein ACR2QK_13445, partial [Acidimicrobiales bacterium]
LYGKLSLFVGSGEPAAKRGVDVRVVVDSYVRDSYRYLRLGLVVATLALGVSLFVEIVNIGCLHGSVSAFYYTPVHAIFIGVLFVIGVTLVALLGRDPVEDMFFNFAGFLAPVVALVPTKRPDDLCGPDDRHLTLPNDALVANNVLSLFIASAVALFVAFILARRSEGKPGISTAVEAIKDAPRSTKVGLTLSAVVLIAGVVWYWAGKESFQRRAHGTAAVLMFVAIWFVVFINANYGGVLGGIRTGIYQLLGAMDDLPSHADDSKHVQFYRVWYRVLGLVMFAAGIVGGIAVFLGVRHAVFWLEVAQIVPFAVFWALQTGERWDPPPPTEQENDTDSVPGGDPVAQ